MKRNDEVSDAVAVTLTDEELLTLGVMADGAWPRPLVAVHDDSRAVQLAAGFRSLSARGLLGSHLPEEAARILAHVLKSSRQSVPSLTLAAVDEHFYLTPHERVEVLRVEDELLLVSSSVLGVHILRHAVEDEIFESLRMLLSSLSQTEDVERIVCFMCDVPGDSDRGYVVHPQLVELTRSDSGWNSGACLDEPAVSGVERLLAAVARAGSVD